MTTRIEKLIPNQADGSHAIKNQTIEHKKIEIGNGEYLDVISGSTIINCEIRIKCSAAGINFFDSTFIDCTIWPGKEIKNLRLSSVTMNNCVFKGKYTGCRFGKDLPEKNSEIKNCDFSQVKLLHLCDFLDGADITECKFPSWPHILITELPKYRENWLNLDLPPDMKLIQEIIGEEDSLAKAVTIYLPLVTDDCESLRSKLESESYVSIS